MSASNKQTSSGSSEPKDSTVPEHDWDSIVDENDIENAGPSEVAIRLNLLGKLIIPPSTP